MQLHFCRPSVYGILMYADGFVQPLLYGMCDSLQPAVGYNLGAGNKRRIRSIEKCCYTASTFMEMAHTAVQLFALTYLTRWFSFATQSYMVAVDRPREASIISLSTALLFPVILVGVFWPLGLTGIWLNFAGTSLLAGILSAVILRKFSYI